MSAVSPARVSTAITTIGTLLDRGMKRILYSLAALIVLVVAALAWLVVAYPARTPAPSAHGQPRTVTLDLAPNSTLELLASQLHHHALIDEPRIFALYARVMGAQDRVRTGRVLVTANMTIRQLLQRTATGYGSTPIRITIPEGYSRFDVAARLAEWNICSTEDFLQATGPQTASGEGYLFPDTYWLNDEQPASQVVRKLADNSQRRLQRLFADEASALATLERDLHFGAREVLILASIVEKEAHVQSEQPVIAGVFLNRLRDPNFRPKRLQADPTVAYGCIQQPELESCQGFDGKRVTRVMTADPLNVYNTYRIEGLPPGPIANPGLLALRAVLHPAEHGYFYFVARGDGRHAFSATLTDHNQAVQRSVSTANP
jgi:UPF0755 protein